MTRALVTIALVLASTAGAARADRREASLHAHLIGGIATTGDPAASGTGSAPLGGLAIRASYATHNAFQYDAALGLLGTGAATFEEGTFMVPGKPTVTGPFTLPTQVARLDGGVTVRLGVELIPTLRVAAGVQGRRRGSPTVSAAGGDVSGAEDTGRDNELTLDLIGSATLGLDYRVNRRLIIGAAAGASYAVPLGGEEFRTLEVTVHVARYFYVR